MYTFHGLTNEDKSQELMRALIQAIPDNIMLVKEQNDEFFDINEKFVDTFGFSRNELVGKTTKELKLWFRERERETFSTLILESGKCENYQAELVAKNGTCIPVLISAQRIILGGEAFVVSACRNVSVMKRIEKSLSENAERYWNIFEQSTDSICILNIETMKFCEFNTIAHTRLGYTREEFAEMTIFDIFEEFAAERFAQCTRDMQKTGSVMLELRDRMITGELRDVLVSLTQMSLNGRPMYHVVVKDITENNKIKEELAKTRKLESLGTLAGGIAHDFNNILTGIQGNLSLIRHLHPSDKKTHVRVARCETAIQQAVGLTSQLLTFSRGGDPVKKIINPRYIINESISFVLSGSKVISKTEIADDLWQIEADEKQFGQVIRNLLINAEQAMPDGGIIHTIAVNCHNAKNAIPSLAKDSYVKISVIDQGTGIPPEHRDKIFDPYFTTKKIGMGLGLTLIYSIVRKHGGHVQVSSNSGKGARFDIYLPACSEHRNIKDVSKKKPVLRKGEGFLVVMDDEEIIRETAKEMLSLLGYDVETCASGEELITFYRRSLAKGKKPDAVIMDLILPEGMGGLEAAEKILVIDPAAKLIVSSGYSHDPVLANYLDFRFVATLNKPFRMEDLIGTLNLLFEKQ